MIFTGPVQPPMLGAALASARIHLSPELHGLQRALRERIELCTRLLSQHDIALASNDGTPICFVPIGSPELAREVARRLLDEGFFTKATTYPAVPIRQAGVRFMLTLAIAHLIFSTSSPPSHFIFPRSSVLAEDGDFISRSAETRTCPQTAEAHSLTTL